MKSVYMKPCPDTMIYFLHDCSECECCLHTNLFYTVFQPALAKLDKRSSSRKGDYFGILKFLDGLSHYGLISKDANTGHSWNHDSKSLHRKPPVSLLDGTFDYSTLLNSIINSKKKSEKDLDEVGKSYSYLYNCLKYGKVSHETVQSLQESDKNNFNYSPRFTRSKKRKSPQVKSKKEVNGIINSRKKSKRDLDEVGKSYSYLYNSSKCDKVSHETEQNLQESDKNKINNSPHSTRSKKGKSPQVKHKKEVNEKVPTRGTLKRKRWLFRQLATDEDYEDDIFEERPFYRRNDLDEVSSTSSSEGSRVVTPVWEFSLSPRGDSPVRDCDCSDCYNVTELNDMRKSAEAYQHSRKKRRKEIFKKNLKSEPVEDLRPKVEDTSRASCSYTIERPVKEDDPDYDSDEIPDVYFTDSEEEKDYN